jgi:hypothetical protein
MQAVTGRETEPCEKGNRSRYAFSTKLKVLETTFPQSKESVA